MNIREIISMGARGQSFLSQMSQFNKADLEAITDRKGSGFTQLRSLDDTTQRIAVLGLLIVCTGMTVRQIRMISRMRHGSCEKWLAKLESEFNIHFCIVGNKVTIKQWSPFLSQDVLPFVKVAFPDGYLIRQKQFWQLF
ncbi:hypothetical protein AAFX24_28520 [Vibrio mediterranei]|uniref:hypothetical protein n=1 Tax=Vibrio mediterranei TaxID=689 RepID=UPI0038CE14CE